MFEASIAPPETAPAPINVCISSINKIALFSLFIALITAQTQKNQHLLMEMFVVLGQQHILNIEVSLRKITHCLGDSKALI
jgi:hypothetical protein